MAWIPTASSTPVSSMYMMFSGLNTRVCVLPLLKNSAAINIGYSFIFKGCGEHPRLSADECHVDVMSCLIIIGDAPIYDDLRKFSDDAHPILNRDGWWFRVTKVK